MSLFSFFWPLASGHSLLLLLLKKLFALKILQQTNPFHPRPPGLIPCKLVSSLQATSVFVSTISITAIALDRYNVIVYPTHQESYSGTRSVLALLGPIWFGALMLSLPLFVIRTVRHVDLRKFADLFANQILSLALENFQTNSKAQLFGCTNKQPCPRANWTRSTFASRIGPLPMGARSSRPSQ